jgi:Fungal specific transcription factor domain
MPDGFVSVMSPLNQIFQLEGNLPSELNFFPDAGVIPSDDTEEFSAYGSSAASDSRMTRASSVIPPSVPFLVNGIESRNEHRFFRHFTDVTSRILTLSMDHDNPILSVVLPRSLQDPMILKSLICLGASHLMNHLEPESSETIVLRADKQRLLQQAEQQQVVRTFSLESLRQGSHEKTTEIEAVLISALLLCLYEISEGKGNGSWNLRLNSARDLVQHALSEEKESESISESMHTDDDLKDDDDDDDEEYEEEGTSPSKSFMDLDINDFLLQFFAYHDVFSNVTVDRPLTEDNPDFSALIQGHYSSFKQGLKHNQVHMLGVNDGLFDLISRIAALRSYSMSVNVRSAIVISQAVGIWQDLDSWRPPSTTPLSDDHMKTYDAYITALFTWLFSIIYPDSIHDEKVQTMVRRGIESLASIEPSGLYTFLLFPLLVHGVSSIHPEDRSLIQTQFDKVENSSRLGNIRLCRGVVQRSWEAYDTGGKRTWDWISLMQLAGISVPVT